MRKSVDGLHGLARLGFVAAEVEIRPGSAADLVALVAALGQRDFFADRLARQHQGRGVLLVAWLAARPVGDVYLLREPADVPKIIATANAAEPKLTKLVLGVLAGEKH